MKTTAKYTIIILALTIIALPVMAEEREKRKNNDDGAPPPKKTEKWYEDEDSDRFFQQIERIAPERAEELKQLKEDNPEQYRKELFEEIMKMHQERQAQDNQGDSDGRRFGKERMEKHREAFKQKTDEFIDWLKENYPDEHAKLEGFEDASNDEKFKMFEWLRRDYKPIFDAEKRNPELAEVLKKDLKLKQERDEIIALIKQTKDEKELTKLKTQLKSVISERFDLVLKKKQFKLDYLLERLERLKKEVKKEEKDLEKLKSKKDKHVEERINELIEPEQNLNWD